MSRTKKSDLIKSSYRLAALIILVSININILSAQTGASTNTHTIGESYRGGIVFYVTPNGRHGLIAETQDQSTACSWYNAQDIISTSSNHSKEGQKFTDWRLPTKNELNLLYLQKSVVVGFANGVYWSSTEFNFPPSDYDGAWFQNFYSGFQGTNNKSNTYGVRAVRAF